LKYTFLLIALFPLVAFSQQQGDTRLIVSLNDTVNVLDKVDSVLKAEGYRLNHKQRKRGYIFTKPEILKGGPNDEQSVFAFRLFENTLIVSGNAKFRDTMYGKIQYSTQHPPWVEMERLAKLFGRVTYAKTGQ